MKNKFLGKVSLVISIFIIAAFIRFSAGDILATNSGNAHSKWNICHHTGSETNPYVKINVSSKSEGGHFDAPGNPLHSGDLLLDDGEDCPKPSESPKPSPTPTPTPTPSPKPSATPTPTPKPHEKWNICHHTESQTNPYVKITVSSKSEGGHFDANGNPLHGGDKLISEVEKCPTATSNPTPTPKPKPTPKPSASPIVVPSTPCINCGGTTVNVTNNNNNTNNSTNNNNVNVTNTAEANVKVPTVLPETGVGAVAAGGVLGVGPLGYYLARVKRGKLIKEVEEENLASTAFGLVNSRLALKQDA